MKGLPAKSLKALLLLLDNRYFIQYIFPYCTPDLQMYFYHLFICLFSFLEPVKIQPAQPKGIENLVKRDLSA